MGVSLGVTERPFNFHIDKSCRKLNVHGRQAAITSAFRSGLLPVASAPSSNPKTVSPGAPENPRHQTSPWPPPGLDPSPTPLHADESTCFYHAYATRMGCQTPGHRRAQAHASPDKKSQ